jgi:hydroxyacylglutathione hydrolase
MNIEQIVTPGLAHFSYLVVSGKEALVIDPRRDIQIYQERAAFYEANIRYVLETHIHADYASGARQLALSTGAELCLSGHDEGEEYAYRFPHRELRDGETLALGKLRVEILHTPGHTPEHLCFLLHDLGSCGEPLALFSGDFLFAGSVGRPDLLGKERTRTLVHELYRSLRRLMDRLPDGVLLFPGHGAGSLCGSSLAERTLSTLGYERHCNRYLTQGTEEEFVGYILSTLPEFPDYYRRMKELNSQGPPLVEKIPGEKALFLEEFLSFYKREDVLVLDVRSPEAFGGAHIPGAVNLGLSPSLPVWAGWVLPYNKDLLLVGERGENLLEARRSLLRVGHDWILGYLSGGMSSWIAAGLPLDHVPQASVAELAERLGEFAANGQAILDVRSPQEWREGHIAGARHIPCGELPKRLQELSKEVSYWVFCGSGYRSGIAVSLLKQAGFRRLVNVIGGMGAWKARNFSLVRD